MAEFYESGRLIDFILVLVVIEAAVLFIYYRRGGKGIAPVDLLPNLCAGAFLLLALRVTLGGGEWGFACGCLAAAGFAHLLDISRRWRG